MNRIYVCIDLKSFYASVECIERGLNPITTNLVVADCGRSEKTICLAVSPTLKALKISGRARLFEVIQKVRDINLLRKQNNLGRNFERKSYDINELNENSSLEFDFIVALPRMRLYIDYSTRIYNVYLKYLAPEDIHIYSIDEVFCDITNYLKLYKMEAKKLVTKIISDIFLVTGITATAGIGPNLYLCKVAMDIVSKHVDANDEGVRIGELNEDSYRNLLWNHQPLTDFWRIGKGYAKKLEKYDIYTMGDIARCSIENESLLFRLFGVNAELLIDHAWGIETCTLENIKKYKPNNNSLGTTQVLPEAYDYTKTKLIIKEMIDLLTLDLVLRNKVSDGLVLTIDYDIKNLLNPYFLKDYGGEIVLDFYGRRIPKHSRGTIKFDYPTSSLKNIKNKTMELFENIVNKNLLVRKVSMSFLGVVDKEKNTNYKIVEQLDFFSINDENLTYDKKKELANESKIQNIVLDIKKKYGKNAILKGINLVEGATTINRNSQIGGHKE